MKKLIEFFLTLLVVSSCCLQHNSTPHSEQKKRRQNPLDLILGDKVLQDSDTIHIRTNNFEQLYSITRKDIEDSSELYTVRQLDSNHFLIQQNRLYSEARNFSIIVKLNQHRVSHFYVSNDYLIGDCIIDSSGCYLLSSDSWNTNRSWQTQYRIKIEQLDSNLQLNWSYNPKKGQYPLNSDRIISKNGKRYFLVQLISGCTICFNVIALQLNDRGECFNAVDFKNHNTSIHFSEEELDPIFRVKKELKVY